jgi:hypothetical protein
MEMVGNHYATLLSYPKHYTTALGNRLWKWYVTALSTVCLHFV